METLGIYVVELILYVAGWLKYEYMPGLFALAFFITLFVSWVIWFSGTKRKKDAVNFLTNQLETVNGGLNETDLFNIDNAVRSNNKTKAQITVASAWEEFAQSRVITESFSGGMHVFSAARPVFFFNIEELGFDAGKWRMLPGIFVSTGLLLTFLGLVAALNTMTGLEVAGSAALENLLKIASAKFIMSLAGLSCSIIFTISLNIGRDGLERSFSKLNRRIEERIPFLALESIALKQLDESIENREQIQRVGTELVAQLGRPLREELSTAISDSISTAMKPVMEQVTEMSNKGVGDMVDGLSARLSDQVGEALSLVSEKIMLAGDQMRSLVERLDQSGSALGQNTEQVVMQLKSTIDEVKENMLQSAKISQKTLTDGTGDLLVSLNSIMAQIGESTQTGSAAMTQAAELMSQSAQQVNQELASAAQAASATLRDEMAQAGSEGGRAIRNTAEALSASIGETAQEINSKIHQMSEDLGARIWEPLNDISLKLKESSSYLDRVGVSFSGLAQEIDKGTQNSERAAVTFNNSAREFRNATAPISEMMAGIKNSSELLAQQSKEHLTSIAQVVQQSSEQSKIILDTAQELLGGQQQAVSATLNSLKELVNEMQGQGERLDTLDVKLGQAFEAYRNEIETAIDSLIAHVRTMNEELTPALDTLSEVVAQAERFIPEQRRQ